MASEDQMEFFRKVKAMQIPGEKITAGKIKTILVKQMVEIEKHTTETAVRGKFLPLSVYEKKGFDIAAIREKAEQQASDLFGVVYRVPILEINTSHIEESVRQTILAAERKVQPKKRSLTATVFWWTVVTGRLLPYVLTKHIFCFER